jgi:hypothetical protein
MRMIFLLARQGRLEDEPNVPLARTLGPQLLDGAASTRRLPDRECEGYYLDMKSSAGKMLPSIARIGLAAVAVAAATGLAFAAWVENGPAILMSMAETGLSWCF